MNISQDSLIHQYKWSSQGFVGRFTNEQVEKLRKHPLVDHVAKDYKYKAVQIISSDTKFFAKSSNLLSSQTIPWGISRVNGPLDGTGKTAWILDTGIDLDHPDLNVSSMKSASFVANENADDMYGHGSHVAGIIAAKNNSRDVVGVAAGASVVSVKVLDQNGDGILSNVVDGVDYITNKASSEDVINMSLGDPSNPSNTSLDDAIINAANAGLRFAIAAGNELQDASNVSPARVENANVWTVFAYDDTDTFATLFSNFGNPPIEYGGPGVDILSLWKDGGTNTISGTSQATPHIAGLLLAAPQKIVSDGTVSGDPDGNPDPIAAQFKVSISGPQGLDSAE